MPFHSPPLLSGWAANLRGDCNFNEPSDLESSHEIGVYPDIRPSGPDPFFRARDAAHAALATERLIQARALVLLCIIILTPWRLGSPRAQAAERDSAFRIIRESMERMHAPRNL